MWNCVDPSKNRWRNSTTTPDGGSGLQIRRPVKINKVGRGSLLCLCWTQVLRLDFALRAEFGFSGNKRSPIVRQKAVQGLEKSVSGYGPDGLERYTLDTPRFMPKSVAKKGLEYSNNGFHPPAQLGGRGRPDAFFQIKTASLPFLKPGWG